MNFKQEKNPILLFISNLVSFISNFPTPNVHYMVKEWLDVDIQVLHLESFFNEQIPNL